MGFSVSEIAAWIGGVVANETVLGAAVNRIKVERPAELRQARATDLAFFFNRAYQEDLIRSAAGVLVTGEPFVKPLAVSGLPLWKNSAVIACADPYLAMAVISEKMAASLSTVAHLEGEHDIASEPRVHPTAIVHSRAELGTGVRIAPYCVIEESARIGEGTVLYPGCYVGTRCVIGRDCVLFPRVTLYEWTELGDRVRIHSGAVLGADGFGYAPRRDPGSSDVVDHEKIYHLGKVVIGDDVEIGANTCIDRATLGETRVERKAKIDDLVMIGHNCLIDEGAVLCGKVGMAGRARVGRFAYIGGGAGLSNDVYVGDRAVVGGHTLISKDVPPGGMVVGNPQRDHKEHFRIQAMLNRLAAERQGARAQARNHGVK